MVTLRGVVIPAAWDERGNVVAVAIATHDENEYLVDNKEKGTQLLELIREEVEVVGDIEDENEKRMVTVQRYGLKRVWDQWDID